jgi:4-carboxymuconolactone decarboxylase
MGKVYDFLHLTNDVLTGSGVKLPLPGQFTTTPDSRSSAPTGSTRCTPTRPRMSSTSSGCCRPTASATTTPVRASTSVPALLTLAMLISLGGADAQVKGHVAANLTVGNDRRLMLAVITRLLPFVGYPRTLNVIRALDEITLA